MDLNGDDDELREELAEEDSDDGGARWGRSSYGYPAPFTALQYPVLQTESDATAPSEAVANLVANLLGVGLLTMPRAMAKAGLVSGILVMIGVAAASRDSLLLLLTLSSETLGERASYPEIGKRAMGPQGLALVLIAYLLYAGGMLAAYLATLVELLGQLFAVLFGVAAMPRFSVVFVAVVLCTPGTMWRSLRYGFFLGMMCMLGVALLVLALLMICLGDTLPQWFPGVPDDSAGMSADITYFSLAPQGLIAAASLFLTQFSVHAGCVEVLGGCMSEEELDSRGGLGGLRRGSGQDRRQLLQDAEAITHRAFVAAAPLVGVIGAMGYMRFGNNVAGNLFTSFGASYGLLGSARRLALVLARLAYAVVLITAFAFLAVPCRSAVLELFAVRRDGGVTTRAFRNASIAILCAAGFVAWLIEDLSVTLGIVGAWAAGPLALILPAIFAVETARRKDGRPAISAKNLRYLGLICLGAIMILGSIVELVTAAFTQPVGHRGHRVTVMHLANITAHIS